MSEVQLSYCLDLDQSYKWLFVTPTQTARNSISYIQELGDFPANAGYFTRRSNLPSYLIKLCIGGAGILEYDGKTYPVRKDQFFWIDCMRPHYYRTDPDAGKWHVVWVHMYGPEIRSYYELFLNQNNGSPVLDAGSNSLIRPIIERMISLYSRSNTSLADDLHAAGLISNLMVQCVSATSPASTGGGISGHVEKARTYIDTHYRESVTLDILAEELSLNKFYLQKTFKKHMGITPNEYLIRTRIQHSKELLQSTDKPISEIALDVGVNNIGHFISLFREHEGVTPSVYRRQWY